MVPQVPRQLTGGGRLVFVVYITALLAGLALAVRVMIAGVVRPSPVLSATESVPARRTRLSPALGAVGATVLGVAGAALSKLDLLGGGARFLVALFAAGLAVGGAGLVLQLWALNPSAPPDPEDDARRQLQGFPATVTGVLSAAGVGEITFRYNGVQQVLPARAIDGVEFPSGAEVVIDRIDSGTAWVESWAQVESRL